MTKPQLKQTTYTQSNTEVLPTLDPVKQNVAQPFTPENAEGKKAAEYLNIQNGADPTKVKVTAENYREIVGPGPFNITEEEKARGRALIKRMEAKERAKAAAAGKKENKESEASDEDEDPFSLTSKLKKAVLTDENKAKFKKLAGDNPKAVFSNIKSVTTTTGDGVDVNFGAVQRRVESAFGVGGAGATLGLSEETKASIVAAATEYGGENVGIYVGDGLKLLDPNQYKDAKGITGLVERLTKEGGTLDVLDFAGQAAMINGLANKLIAWGAPEILDQLIDMVKDIMHKNAMYESLCIRSAGMGNLEVTEHYGKKMGSSRRHAIGEQVVHNLISRFIIPRKTNQSDKYWGERLLKVLAQFKMDWDTDQRDHVSTCLYYYSIQSTDAEKVLRLTNRRVHTIAGKHVRMARPASIIYGHFPDLVL